MISKMEPRHVPEVARLHCLTLAGLLSRLGRRAVEAYYLGVVGSAAGTALVAEREGRIIGFAAGSEDPVRLKREVSRAHPARILLGVASGLLRRPAALIDLAASLKGPPAGSYDPRQPELTYLAVTAEVRGSGVGKRLVEAFSGDLAQRGIDAFELSVDADNLEAIRFYEKLGFEPLGQYREFSTLHRRYRLQGPPRGGGVKTG